MQNQLKQIIKHDLTIGINQNIPKYLLSIFLCSLFCMTFYHNLASMKLTDGSLIDCSIYLFEGISVYKPSPQNPFKIPVVWMLIQVMVALLIVSYPTEDLHSYGIQVLTRAKNRSKWWLSKCIWNIVTVISFYLTVYLVVLIFASLLGKLSFIPDQKINLVINSIDLNNINITKLLVAVFLLPMIVSITMSQLQMALSFILSPIYSFIIIVCILIASAYFGNPIFIGNYSMLLRNELVYPKGMNSTAGIIINLSVAAVSILLGYFYIQKCDVLKKG